jgi:hypothetical protein
MKDFNILDCLVPYYREEADEIDKEVMEEYDKYILTKWSIKFDNSTSNKSKIPNSYEHRRL